MDGINGGSGSHQGTPGQSVERERRPRESAKDDVIARWRVDPLIGIGSARDLGIRSGECRIVLSKNGSRTNRELRNTILSGGIVVEVDHDFIIAVGDPRDANLRCIV